MQKPSINRVSHASNPTKNAPLAALIALYVFTNFAACKSSGEKEQTPSQPTIEQEAPKPIEIKKPLIYGGKDIGELLYQDGRFVGVVGQKSIGSKTIHNKIYSLQYITSGGWIYFYPQENFHNNDLFIRDIVPIEAQGIEPITNNVVLLSQGDKMNLFAGKILPNAKISFDKKATDIQSFVTITDTTIGSVQNISEYPPQTGFRQNTIFITKEGKKFYALGQDEYSDSQLPTVLEIKDVKRETITDKNGVKEIVYIIGTDNKKYLLTWSSVVPFDTITKTTTGHTAYMLNGNLVKWENPNLDVGNMIYTQGYVPLKKGRFKQWIDNQTPTQQSHENRSLSDAINATKPVDYTQSYNDVSKTFAGFKIKYVGILYGEGEEYAYSQNGKDFYVFYSSDDTPGYCTVTKVDNQIDEIVSVNPLDETMKKSHLFVGNYFSVPKDRLRYIGLRDGYEIVEYTIKGAEGSKIQSGDEVKSVLIDNILEQPTGYTISFFYKDAGVVKPLGNDTPCPQGTVIVIKYAKI